MQLNDSQKQFINTDSKFIRLLAPAGAGKTVSLLYRCVRLIKEDSSRRVLIVTFTKVARAVLQERIKTDDEFEPLRGKVDVSTLNAFGYKLIKNERPHVKIIDFSQRANTFYHSMRPVWTQKKYERVQKLMQNNYLNRAKELFELIDNFKELGFDDNADNDQFSANFTFLINDKVRFFKANLKALCSFGFITKVAYDNWDTQKIIENLQIRWYPFFCDFSQGLYEQELITLNDQKFKANYFLQEKINTDNRPRKSSTFSDIFVDEFQDVSPLDLMFIKSLVSYHQSDLVIAGDDDQAIFEFRGSSPNFMINPDQYFDGKFSDFTLGVNYRSPQNIVDVSQKLIVNNRTRVPKEISTSSVGNAEIEVVEKKKSSELFEYVMNEVKADLNSDHIGRIALVARKRSQLLPYEVLFTKEQIDYFTPDDLNMFLAKAFDELQNLLDIKKELLCHPDWITPSKIVMLCDKIKEYPLKKSQKEELLNYLNKNLTTEKTIENIYSAIKTCHLSFTITESRRRTKRKYKEIFAEAIKDFLQASTVAGTIRIFADHFEGFSKHFGKSEDDIFYTDPPFYHLIDFAENYGDNFGEFLHDIELAIEKSKTVFIRHENNNDSGNPQVNKRLHLTTALRIKGEEYDAVYVLDANDKIWPNINAKEEDELESERRLFYVASTRARNKLIFSLSTQIHGEIVVLSRYLDEMGLE
ncbi:MAG: ATP-dependent helicase [Planctomycetaceae bacterium]|jgi:DNA helicase-2/ATP-dependent DNA helicase PcrA|nr:ATP-dependent helicase [Planctomycetaceae bacterium]